MLRRMEKEFGDITKDPINGVVIEKDPQNQLYWNVLIAGPADTPYVGGQFKVRVTFPENYPFRMPDFKFETLIWHPNVL